jgi:hypothetical protein
MTLDALEFLRRFFLHVLPRGFVRIRHYGLLSNRFRNRLLPLAHTLLAADGRQQPSLPPTPNCELWHCPRCGSPMRVANASLRHNSIWQPSTPHDRLCQSGLPTCSTHAFAQVCPDDAESLSLQAEEHRRTHPSQVAYAPVHQFSSPSPTMTDPRFIYPTMK